MDAVVGDGARDVMQQPASIERLDLDRYDEGALLALVPPNVDHPSLLPRGQNLRVGAILAVNRHSPAASKEADDGVAGDGGTAPGQAHEQVVEALDDDALAASLAWAAPRRLFDGLLLFAL